MELSGYPYAWLVVIGILVFFAVRLAIGYWASRMVSNAADYIVAGRRLPVYIAGASIMATWFAAETLMGAAATAYRSGFQGVIFDPFGAALCLLISGVFFIRLMRRARYLTVVGTHPATSATGARAASTAARMLARTAGGIAGQAAILAAKDGSNGARWSAGHFL